MPMDPRYKYMPDEQEVHSSRKRSFKPCTMLFMFFFVLGGGTEGSRDGDNISFYFEIFCGSVSNYHRHVADALFKVLHDDPYAFIEWSSAQERMDMRVLVCRFPTCISFIDGMKQYFFRPLNPVVGEENFTGHHKEFCYSTFVWTDGYRIIFGIYINLSVKLHER